MRSLIPLRRRAGRPQLKRDPLDSTRQRPRIELTMRGFLVPAALLWVTFAVRPPLQGGAYRITDVRAHLYYPELGTFDTTNITSQYKPTLWNTIIGEGRAEAPSQATLVLVQISGIWLSRSKPPRLHMIVSPEGRRPLLDRTVDLSQF